MLIDWVACSCVGRVSRREIVSLFDKRNGTVPDSDYLSELEQCSGGIPRLSVVHDKKGGKHRIGRFVNYLSRSTITGPLQPSFLDPETDQRLWWSFGGLMSIENIRCGMAGRLMPFALLCSGENHSDEMDPTHLNLLCFNYSKSKVGIPTVVFWNNDRANEEYFRCQDEDEDETQSEEMNLDVFTVPIADSFRDFTLLLKSS